MSNLHLILIAALSALAVATLVALIVLRQRRGRKSSQLTVASISPGLAGRFSALFTRGAADAAFFSELEETLIEADVGVPLTARLLESVHRLATPEAIRSQLASRLRELLERRAEPFAAKPRVTLVLGVNGVGKTTTIAKLARQRQSEGRRVLLVAGDTFRAAAVEQLSAWGGRLNCEVVAQGAGADAAAVAFDGVSKAMAKGYDDVIIDTAGRLHTKQNLMEELKKVVRVIGKACAGSPHEKLIVIDATVGGNGLVQARQFHEAVGLTGAIVTKLDGTARGGVVASIVDELKIPVTHIGIGEGMEHLRPFDAAAFVKAILGEEGACASPSKS